MIRRQEGQKWLLIDQVNHAHLAAELASAWGNDEVPALPVPELLIPAIRHHDDGWKQWAAAPEIDPTTGRPRNFTEMPMPVSTQLWRRSIEVCAAQSPLAGIWISRHFCHLAEKARQSRQDNDADLQAIEHFLAEQQTAQHEWKEREATRSRELTAINDQWLDSLIELGLQYVQFFDALSLWLCCEPYLEMQPQKTAVPDGPTIRWTPRGLGYGRYTEIAAQPYPFSRRPLELSVAARSVRAQQYANDQELHEAMQESQAGYLRWRIVAVPAGWFLSGGQ